MACPAVVGGRLELAGEKQTKAERRRTARERLAAQREAERKRARNRRIATLGGAGVVVLALAAAGGWVLLNGSKPAKPKALPKPVSQSVPATLPPWPVPADTITGARAAGLIVNNMEGTVQHFHAHLDIIVNGKPVTVPANLGISVAEQAISELHTHDTRGVLHIESSSRNERFILGQAFTEWRVKLTSTSLGGLTTDGKNTLTAYVDGTKWTGDPAAIELKPHREIALVFGPADQKVNVPSSYAFDPNE